MGTYRREYKVRVHIGRRSGGGEQLQVVVWRSLEPVLGSKRMTIRFFGTKMCFMPDGDKKKIGNYSSSAPKFYSENEELLKYARSFEGEYHNIHKHENGFLYVDAAEVKPFTRVLPSRCEVAEPKSAPIVTLPYIEEPKVNTAEDDAVATILALIDPLQKKRDEALALACECDRKIEALKNTVSILKGEV